MTIGLRATADGHGLGLDRRRTLAIVGAVVVAVCALLWLVFLRPPSLGGSTSYVVVSGRSMKPTLRDGDLVLVRQHDEYDIGDVIAFRVPDGSDDLVIHRVVGGSAAEGYVTRGDNRQTDDPWQTLPDDVLGSRIVRVPRLGGVIHAATSPFWRGLVLGACGASLIWALRELTRGRAGARASRPIAPPAEVVAHRIHREYEATTDPAERLRIRRLAFEAAGVLAQEHPGLDTAAFLRECGTHAYDGRDVPASRHHQR